METIDSGKITILTALDMSAAFDTLDHATLLHRLEHTFGLSGFVISWIRSYLTNRSSFVKIDSSSSPSTTISTFHRCAPGLCPWPLSFCSFHITCCQCNKSWPGRNQQPGIGSSICWWHPAVYRYKCFHASISGCLNRILHPEGPQLASEQWSSPQSIQVWSHCFFQLKVQTLSKPWLNLLNPFQLPVPPIKLQSSIKNLGVYLDSKMSFDKQVSETCKASYFHIRALRHIRSSLTTDADRRVWVAHERERHRVNRAKKRG